jgi:Asp-tRNA(Asn)/Glu-tRNA(Gln) amidotransferase C subunit
MDQSTRKNIINTSGHKLAKIAVVGMITNFSNIVNFLSQLEAIIPTKNPNTMKHTWGYAEIRKLKSAMI